MGKISFVGLSGYPSSKLYGHSQPGACLPLAHPWKNGQGMGLPQRCEKGRGPGVRVFTFTQKAGPYFDDFFRVVFFFLRKKNIGFAGFQGLCVFFWFLTHFISGRLAYKNSLFYVMDFFNGHRRFGGQEIETPKNYLQYLFCLPGSCQKCQPQWPLWDFFFLDFSLGLLGSMVIGSMGYFTEKLING